MTTISVLRAQLGELIGWLECNAANLPSLPDVTDADMALMYLRHLARHLATEVDDAEH